jgi:PAS domain S-box-containing protein
MNQAVRAVPEAERHTNLLNHWYALLDHIHVGVYICDRNAVVIRYNKRAADLWGLAPVPGKPAVKYCGSLRTYTAFGTPLNGADSPIGKVLRTKRPVRDCETIIERPDGSFLHILANADPLFDEDGEIIGAVNCIQDITARKQTEAREAQGRRMLEAIVATTPECIKLVAADGTLLQMNAAGCQMLQMKPEQVIGTCVFDVIAPECREAWRANHARICAGESLSWEFDLIGGRGMRRRMETHAAPFSMPDGSIAHLALTREITERRRHEHELQEQKKQLQDLLQALPAAVYTTDADGHITFFNDAAVEMAGRTPRIGEDQWCVTWKLLKPDGTPLAHDACPMAIALKENRAVRGEEAVALRPDGVRVPFLPYPTPLRDAAGNLVGAINMLVDISERKQAEYQQRMLLDELNHRVKNNLQMLHSLLLAARRDTASAEASTVLGDAAHRVGAIAAAQRVLYSARDAATFDSNEFLQAVCTAAHQAFAGDVKIQVAPSSGTLSNEVSMPLALILNELLTNAVKHGLKNRKHGTIKVQLTRAGADYNLIVEDDGCGFDLQPSQRRSSGIGLVAGLARQLGGTFDIRRGEGACCIVSFPGNRNVLH